MSKLTKFKLVSSLLAVAILLGFSLPLISQVPQGFNYQALARDATGNPILNTALPVKIDIQSDSLGTAVIWEELFSSVSTNGFGIFNLVIGRGARQVNSTVAAFSDIDWNVSPKFLRTQIYYLGNWKDMGSTRLWSVPYASIAGDLGGSVKKLAVTGTTTNMDEPLFEVKNRTGQTVFAVFNEGVRIYVDNGIAKGATKGGFAIGGFGTAKAPSQDLFWVTPDSIRMYIDDLPVVKNTKGGFAIGGFDRAKASGNREYLRVTNDSTRINVNPTPVKGTKGGFAIGGFPTAKGAPTNFMNLNPENYFIGQESGINNTTGKFNSFLGYQNGFSNTSGSQNVFLGYRSGFSNVTGINNTFIGNEAGKSNTASNNVFIGHQAGLNSSTGDYNVGIGSGTGYTNSGGYNTFIGFKAGFENTTGSENIFIGYMSGLRNTTGADNIALGYNSGYSNTVGYHNVFIGVSAGYNNIDGFNNIFVGESTGYQNSSGASNIFLGGAAGLNNTSGSNNLFLGVSTGRLNNTGYSNIFIGTESGYSNTTGSKNLFLGIKAGYYTSTGTSNLYFGESAGLANSTGSNNVGIGTNAGASNSTGMGNVLLGHSTGQLNTGSNNTMLGAGAGMLNTGSNNLFLGYYAGYNETLSNRLYIENSQADKNNSLIYGEFDNNTLTFNAKVGINKTTPVAPLDITSGNNWDVLNGQGDFRIGGGAYSFNIGMATAGGGAGDVHITAKGGSNRIFLGGGGADILLITSTNVLPWTDNFSSLGASGNRWSTVYAANGVINTSDKRLKSNIQDINYGLQSIMKLQPVSFTWKDDSQNSMRLGLIAQDVEKVINPVVDKGTDPSQTLGINYSELIPVLIKGMQEQQALIEQLQREVKELKEGRK
jgi:hypothetical protein